MELLPHLNLPLKAGKHNLYEIREKLLTKQRKLIHLNPDEYFDSLSISELQNHLSPLGELDEKMGVDEMKKLMKNYNIQEIFKYDNDASTVANHSQNLFSMNILYDQALLYTNDEYKKIFGEDIYTHYTFTLHIYITHLHYMTFTLDRQTDITDIT